MSNGYDTTTMTSIPVILVFHEIGNDDPKVFVGNVPNELFHKLKTLHNKYGNVDDEFDSKLAYDESGNLIFESAYNLKRITKPEIVSGHLIVTGFYC